MDVKGWWDLTAKETIKKYLKAFGYRHIPEMTFWLTHRCVYKCKFCVIEDNSGPFLPKETVFSLVQEALPLGLSVIPITGGEPMLHPDFAEICNYCRDHVPTIALHVTGKLVNKKSIKELERKGRRWVWWLTIVSHHPEINDKYRSEGAFEDAVRANNLLRERGHYPLIAVNVVPESVGHLEETVKFAFEELKTTYVTTEPIGPMGRAVQNSEIVILNDEQLHLYYKKMTDLIPYWKQRGKEIDALNIMYGLPKRCEYLWQLKAFNVHPTGLICPCCFFLEEDGSTARIEEGARKATSLARGLKLEKYMAFSHNNVEERVKKVGIWSCFECLLNYQVHIKGQKHLLDR